MLNRNQKYKFWEDGSSNKEQYATFQYRNASGNSAILPQRQAFGHVSALINHPTDAQGIRLVISGAYHVILNSLSLP